MDIYTRYNRNSIKDRQIDTLIGLSKGLVADGIVSQTEAEALQTWLIQNSDTDNPIVLNLLDRVSEMLVDGVLDNDEASDLLLILQSISGDKTEIGEVAKPSALPLSFPAPNINFQGRSFLFTGTCAFGSRKDCHYAVEALGGSVTKNVTKTLSYLVIGTYVSDSWKHETFGRKIEKAMEYAQSGIPISIVSEEHWLKFVESNK